MRKCISLGWETNTRWFKMPASPGARLPECQSACYLQMMGACSSDLTSLLPPVKWARTGYLTQLMGLKFKWTDVENPQGRALQDQLLLLSHLLQYTPQKLPDEFSLSVHTHTHTHIHTHFHSPDHLKVHFRLHSTSVWMCSLSYTITILSYLRKGIIMPKYNLITGVNFDKELITLVHC